MKRIFIFFGIIFAMLSFLTVAHASDMVVIKTIGNEIQATVGRIYIEFDDAQPFIDENGRTQIPVRALSESLGYAVSWDEDSQTVSVSAYGKLITLVIGSSAVTINGMPYTADTVPRIVNDHTYVPLRIIGELLGYNVLFYDRTDKNALIMGTDTSFPPYSYYDSDGNMTGIDIELGQAIAKRLGKTLQITDTEFDLVLAGTQSGRYDFSITGITRTEDRAWSMDFSEPYIRSVQSVIVTDSSPVRSVGDLYADGAEYIVGVKFGTTADIYAPEDFGEQRIRQFITYGWAIAALIEGKVDCAILDGEPAKQYVSANPELKILDTPYEEEEYHVIMPKGSPLTDDINAVIAQMKADGTLDEIISKYIYTD